MRLPSQLSQRVEIGGRWTLAGVGLQLAVAWDPGDHRLPTRPAVDGSQLARALADVRAVTTATSLDQLARRLGVTRDDLDAMIGYWVHRGELVMEETVGYAAGSCRGCALASNGCAPQRSGPVLVTIRPARSE